MPLRHYCITTLFLQLFSVATFISFWVNQKYTATFYGSSYGKQSPEQYLPTVSSEFQNLIASNQRRRRHHLAEVCLPIGFRADLCPKLFMGDRTVDDPLKLIQPPPTPQCRLSELIKDCSRLTAAHEYFDKQTSEREKDFPLAFGIKMHRDPEQTERLLRTIYRPHNVYCIYVDGKASKIVFQIMKQIGRCFDNVFVVENRLNVVYASFAHMQSDLQCMRILSRKSIVKWKYYINLTGQEFPLKTNLEMVEILASLNGANDIESYNTPQFLKWRFEKKYYTSGINLVETSEIKEPFRYNVEISKGSAYGAFSRGFVEFLLNDSIANEFIRWLNNTYSPEENVWATLNTLPWAPGGYETEIRHKYGTFLSRAINWEDDKPKCHGKYVRSVCVFGIGDLPWLGSRPQLIANKFDYHFDHLVLDCLEDLLRNRTRYPSVHRLDWYYYKTLPQSKIFTQLDKKHSAEYINKQKQDWIKKQGLSNEPTKLKRNKESHHKYILPGSSIQMYTVPRK
uniref:Beta-1,3-galactosyl-O-glycosyl-glycoprotein beta-1,6-N-acetylglucosaminyltransferase 3-like n=1 Tax=Crassostrea virginica TaxID=6565 RepID=A0A8B8EG21_CRAVI|nr:beta-1,3-galactosyl-O-glycosyl-glycoprotein beta-1,6-N-acetylglucosaminyltransferase 3-like [Crassostrea virginica]XP_022338578.1 beta-1,3-galactosyl-O-glycosyl-glycoprotein beta-1,6-N-acetylglucosaminyltransferase 3-like [Crassostrea virginica]